MVDYKYKDLYNKPHIDKQMKIIACDFVGYGTPESKYPAKLEYEGKVYLDAEANYYYKCRKSGISYTWEKVGHEYELLAFKNSDIDWENFELSESLCSESELRFGCCEASVLKFRIHNTFVSLKDKWVTATEVLEGHSDSPFQFGRYKVFSDVPTADRLYRDVTAYDSMYDIINSSAINWYNTILPERNSKVTMRQFRTSFVNYFGLEQEEITLVNDDMIVEKTIQVEEGVEIENETEHTSILKESSLSGKDVITAICEINGCFGHIGRSGKFRYVYLNQDIMGLYPSNTLFPDHAPWYLKQSETGHLYPQDPKSTSLGAGKYKSCQYEDFICKRIAKLQIRQEENDIGKIWPEGEKRPDDNCYIIENNFLVYGKPSDELKVVAKNIFDKISDIVYRPFFADCVGNPCLEVGDPVRLPTKYELVESYILTRNLKGIQSLTDGYGASGSEKYSEKMNGIHNSILQLKSKANILKRTIEETRSELIDSDQGLNSLILQTAGEIRAEVKNTKEGLESSIIQKAEEITSTVSAATSKFDTKNYEVDLFGYEDGEEIKYEASENNGKYYLNQGNGNLYLSNGASWELVEQLKLITENLSSRIEQTVKSIKLEVKNGEKTAGISITLENEDGFESELKGIIEMSGMVVFSDLSNEGKTTINGKNITTGEINCDLLNGGEINGQKIVGGEIEGSIVKAINGIHLQYLDSSTRPPTTKTYLFAKTGYDNPSEGGIPNHPFLNIYSPLGTPCIIIGTGLYSDNPDEFKLMDTPYFPNGAVVESAFIKSLQQTFKEEAELTGTSEGSSIGKMKILARVSGAFVCVYGSYFTKTHMAGESVEFQISDKGSLYLPKHHSVRSVSNIGTRPFFLTIDTGGVLSVRNVSNENIISEERLEMPFRFDFFRF